MRFDLVSLRIFVAVAECGSLTRGADREHLAISAVSKRIADLEDLVRTPLLQRLPRGVGLTPAGQALMHHARQMIHLVDRMSADLDLFAGGVKGLVRVHAVASALTQFLPEEIESFLTQYPGVRLTLEEHTGKAVVLGVANGSADVGVVASHTTLQGLKSYPYHVDRLVLGVPVGHPLARRKSIRFEHALDHAFVGPHGNSSLAVLMNEAAHACSKRLDQRVQASSFDAMCRLVETSLGIAVLPAGVLEHYVLKNRLRAVKLDEPWALRQMSIIVRDENQLGPIAMTFIEHLQRSANSQSQKAT